MNNQLILISFAVLLASGCATSYQKQSVTGGFDEVQIAPDVWMVSFKGNGYTDTSRAKTLALLRSADLTLQNGFDYFVILDATSDQSVMAYTSPTTSITNVTTNRYGSRVAGTATTTNSGGTTMMSFKPSAENTIRMFKARPENVEMVYDARFVCASVGAKYQVECEVIK